MVTGAGLKVVDRTRALATFRSPLDKTAFIFARRANDDETRGRLARRVTSHHQRSTSKGSGSKTCLSQVRREPL